MRKYETGEAVRLLFDVVSDGTVRGAERGEQVLPAGVVGYVRNSGIPFRDETVYTIHFPEPDRIIRCREKELVPIKAPWNPPQFRKGDRIQTACELEHKGRLVAPSGTAGTIGPIMYHAQFGYVYETTLDGVEELCILTGRQLAPLAAEEATR